jgi:hypothetical protein
MMGGTVVAEGSKAKFPLFELNDCNRESYPTNVCNTATNLNVGKWSTAGIRFEEMFATLLPLVPGCQRLLWNSQIANL